MHIFFITTYYQNAYKEGNEFAKCVIKNIQCEKGARKALGADLQGRRKNIHTSGNRQNPQRALCVQKKKSRMNI